LIINGIGIIFLIRIGRVVANWWYWWLLLIVINRLANISK
jgi:hypothetical protein